MSNYLYLLKNCYSLILHKNKDITNNIKLDFRIFEYFINNYQ